MQAPGTRVQIARRARACLHPISSGVRVFPVTVQEEFAVAVGVNVLVLKVYSGYAVLKWIAGRRRSGHG